MEFTLHGSCINNPCSSDRDGQVTDFSHGKILCRRCLAKPPCVRLSVSVLERRSVPPLCSTSYRFLMLLHLSSKIKSTVGVPGGYMCRFMCKARWSDLEKALSQRWHWKGRWPVCLR